MDDLGRNVVTEIKVKLTAINTKVQLRVIR